MFSQHISDRRSGKVKLRLEKSREIFTKIGINILDTSLRNGYTPVNEYGGPHEATNYSSRSL